MVDGLLVRRSFLFATLFTLLVASSASAYDLGKRELLFRQEFSTGSAGNMQQVMLVDVPAGYDNIQGTLVCNTHAGGIVLHNPVSPRPLAFPCEPDRDLLLSGRLIMWAGQYSGVASFTGVNGAVFEITGVASST